jgi:hypothetical protein
MKSSNMVRMGIVVFVSLVVLPFLIHINTNVPIKQYEEVAEMVQELDEVKFNTIVEGLLQNNILTHYNLWRIRNSYDDIKQERKMQQRNVRNKERANIILKWIK